MKRICICITYHMEKMVGNASDKTRYFDTAESCITTSVTNVIAEKFLNGNIPLVVETWLNNLAEMQGYPTAKFCCAEKVE